METIGQVDAALTDGESKGIIYGKEYSDKERKREGNGVRHDCGLLPEKT